VITRRVAAALLTALVLTAGNAENALAASPATATATSGNSNGGDADSRTANPSASRPGIRDTPRHVVLTPGKFSRRSMQIAIVDGRGRTTAIVSCPARCPNQCIAASQYAMTFCMCDFYPGVSCGEDPGDGGASDEPRAEATPHAGAPVPADHAAA
jgi:hypothetical protein